MNNNCNKNAVSIESLTFYSSYNSILCTMGVKKVKKSHVNFC